MRGALKVTYTDGKEEFFEVDPVGNAPDFVANLDAFLSRPTITLVMDDEILVIPSASIRHFTISRTHDELPPRSPGRHPRGVGRRQAHDELSRRGAFCPTAARERALRAGDPP